MKKHFTEVICIRGGGGFVCGDIYAMGEADNNGFYVLGKSGDGDPINYLVHNYGDELENPDTHAPSFKAVTASEEEPDIYALVATIVRVIERKKEIYEGMKVELARKACGLQEDEGAPEFDEWIWLCELSDEYQEKEEIMEELCEEIKVAITAAV